MSNGRSARLSNPSQALGLFWNIVPCCFSVDERDKLRQVESVQRKLVEIGPYVTYPLPQVLSDLASPALFFAMFNFVHFHNMESDGPGPGLRVVGRGTHGKYHFPLNWSVARDPSGPAASLR